MLDFLLILASSIALFAQAVLGLFVTTRPPSKDRRAYYEAGFIIVTAIGLVAIVWAGWRSNTVQNTIASRVARIFQKVSPHASEEPPKIFAECIAASVPNKIPTSGAYYVLMLNAISAEDGGGGLAEFFGPPGAEAKWPPQITYNCRLTNYGTEPVFRVELAMHLTFREIIKSSTDPTSGKVGKVIIDRDWPIPISKIDEGVDSAFSFVIMNMSPQFVTVRLPANVSYQLGDSAVRNTVPLLQPTTSYIEFPPAQSAEK